MNSFSIRLIFGAILLLAIGLNQTFAQKTNKITEKTFHENGILKTKGKLVNGLRHGVWFNHNLNGKLESKEFYKHGKLLYIVYYNEQNRKTKWVDANGNEHVYKTCNCKP